MKNRKRALKILRNLAFAAILLFLLWFGSDFEPDGFRGGIERLRRSYMLETLQPMERGFGNEFICDAGEDYALVCFSGRDDHGFIPRFFEKDAGVSVIPSLQQGRLFTDGFGFYAVGRVPGAEYVEAEVIVYAEGVVKDPPWKEIYSARADCGEAVTEIMIEPKYDREKELQKYETESLIFYDLSSSVHGPYGNSPRCIVKLRYYGGGELQAEYTKTLVAPVNSASHGSYSPGYLK